VSSLDNCNFGLVLGEAALGVVAEGSITITSTRTTLLQRKAAQFVTRLRGRDTTAAAKEPDTWVTTLPGKLMTVNPNDETTARPIHGTLRSARAWRGRIHKILLRRRGAVRVMLSDRVDRAVSATV
jgi:hypothetical protein